MKTKVIVALDYADEKSALQFVAGVTPNDCKLKVGKELFTRTGPQFIGKLVEKGFSVFLDLKFHDIPHTVKQACYASADLGVWMLNVHASGGRAMLAAAKEGCDMSSHSPLLIGVTVLTSMDNASLKEVGVNVDAAEQVLRLATLVHESQLNGVVCSALEVGLLRQSFPDPFLLVTPGIRPATSASGDQKRIMTPEQAISAGSSYLVIGRPITQAPDPIAVLQQINASLD